MEKITDNSFADWLYNRFVEAVRKDELSKSFIYQDILYQTDNLLPGGRKYSAIKRRAKAHIKAILKASKSGSLKKLHYTGAEFVADYRRVINEYEQELRNMNFDEEAINYLVSQKRETYGND